MTSSDGCCAGCCSGTETATPAGTANPPGRDRLAYRTGDHGQLLASMLTRLSSPAHPAMHGLMVRGPDDPSIAVLDAWALLGDVLTFHTERIANEGYLATATDPESLRLLGELVGHTPRPGVAATTYLAYTVDQPTVVPAGTRAQSVPGPGELPRSFETDGDLPARPEWNGLAVRSRRPYRVPLTPASGELPPTVGRRTLHLAGAGTRLEAGERLLFVFGTEPGRQALETVKEVTKDSALDVLSVRLPGARLATFEGLGAQLRELTRKAEEGAEGDPEYDGAMYHRSIRVRRFVENVLKPLVGRLGEQSGDPLRTPTRLGRAVDEALERLDETVELAANNVAIRNWLISPLRRDLSALRARIRLLEPDQLLDTRPSAVGSLLDELALPGGAPAQAEPALLGLAALLSSLRRPPGRVPVNGRALRRDPGRLFAGGSEAGVRLLTALDPRVAQLWRAWRNVDLTAPPALAGLQVMRTVSTVFGSSAPLRFLGQKEGEPPEYDEWPLPGSSTLAAEISYDVNGPDELKLTWQRGDDEVTATAPLSAGDTQSDVPLGSANVMLAYPPLNGGPRKVTLTGLPLGRKIAFTGPQDGIVTVEVDLHIPRPIPLPFSLFPVSRSLARGDEELFTHLGLRFVVGRSPEGQADAVTVIAESTQGPISPTTIVLDSVYPGIGPGAWVVVERPNAVPSLRVVVTRVEEARVVSHSAFGITGKATELVLTDPWLDPDIDTSLADIRRTTVYAGGEPLTVATEPIPDDIVGDTLELGELYEGLEPGHWLIVAGERTDIPDTPGVPAAELTMVAGVSHGVDPSLPGEPVHTTITLAGPLGYTYRRDTVTVHGNVVQASQGATCDEALGSGDASVAGQTFVLSAGPLTWLPADNPRGARSTLEIRVDGVAWTEVESLTGRPADATVYVTSAGPPGPDGVSRRVVRFGDGVHGARLPTGHENVRARYRIELGEPGNVAAGTITTSIDRPLGVGAVTNPLPATGGVDPDGPRQARRQIPLEVSALDRLVGVPDYEDFALSRAGIGRASVRELRDSRSGRTVVHVTIAGAGDVALTDDSGIAANLRSALLRFGDPRMPVQVAVREPVLLVVAAGVKVARGHSFEIVEPRLRGRLLAEFGFDNRELGQPAFLSELMRAAHDVPGVEYLDVDVFAGVPGSLTPAGLQDLAAGLTQPHPVVPARLATEETTVYDVRAPEGVDPATYRESLTLIAARNGISVAELVRLNPSIDTADPLPHDSRVVIFAGIRPAQLVLLSPALPDTLILEEVPG